MLEDETSKVKGKAIEVVVMMFQDFLEDRRPVILKSTDYKVFENYIYPAFTKLKNETSTDLYLQH
jgi:hypothetical protein